jgi:hypothetical protein
LNHFEAIKGMAPTSTAPIDVVSDVAHSKEHKVWNAVGVIEVWISYSD